MANIILSISDEKGSKILKLPGLQNYEQSIGSKKDVNVALTTEEGCTNFELPFTVQRVIEVAENSVVSGVIDVDRRLAFTNSNISLRLGVPAVGGIKVEVSADFSSGTSTVKNNNGSVIATLTPGCRMVFISTRTLAWEKMSMQTTNLPSTQPNSYVGAIWLS